MDIKLNTPEPVPQPEPTITLELSLREANIVRAALGVTGGYDDSEVYEALYETLSNAGFDLSDVGDLMVPCGPMEPYRF